MEGEERRKRRRAAVVWVSVKACQPAQVAFCLDSSQSAREWREGRGGIGENQDVQH